MRAPEAIRPLAAALAFLTIVPVGRRVELDAVDVGRGSVFFPLVGAGIGAAVGLTAVALDDVLPTFVAAALAIALDAVITGALHLDALADVADGLGGGTRERALSNMRDPRIGSFGAVALVLDLLVKFAAVLAVLELERAVLILLAAWAVGRSAPLVLASVLPYARADSGSGRTLTEGAGTARLLLGLALASLIVVVATGDRSFAIVAAAAVSVLLIGLVARARFGGVTGDVLGAAVEVTTTVALLGAVAAW
jgi:cobalamin 5'-phosphate synthase/cobalamin synthase